MKRQDDNPPTVGFNLNEMREHATRVLMSNPKVMDAFRAWAHEMDKIDTLAEMFNAQHQAAVAQVNGRAGSPKTRSNGHATPESKPKRQFSKAALTAMRENATKARVVRLAQQRAGKGHKVVNPGSMRDLVLSSLAKLGEASPKEITTYLIEKQGQPPERGNNTLSNHVNWTLRYLLKQNRVVRQENGTQHPIYRLP
jgi:hypothetical protein